MPIQAQLAAVALADSLIASVAVRLGLTLVTGNTDDFEAIRRLGTAASSNDEALIAALAENSVQ